MNWLEIKKILKKKTVGIAGAGGLGSNCAVALARVGIGKLVIADFDLVTLKNLNRQYYFRDQVGQHKVFALQDNIFFINSAVKVEAHCTRLGPESVRHLFSRCDVIVEAFDRADMKQMIIETVLSEMAGIPVISGVGMAGWGRSELIGLKRIGNLYICGDGVSEVSDEMPPIAPRVGIVANMQADTVLEILLKKNDPV